MMVDKRLRLRCKSTSVQNQIYGNPSAPDNPMKILHQTNGVFFPYTPTVTYKQNPLWQSQDLTHSIQQYYYFTATESAQISIGGRFTVQNNEEGQYLLAVWHFLRSYSKMHFGSSDPRRGLPPPILLLDGYGGYVFKDLPVIIQTWNMDFPSDVDYVRVNPGSTRSSFTEDFNSTFGLPSLDQFKSFGQSRSNSSANYAFLPSSTNINITVVVQNTPNTLKSSFNLQDFREGRLINKGFT